MFGSDRLPCIHAACRRSSLTLQQFPDFLCKPVQVSGPGLSPRQQRLWAAALAPFPAMVEATTLIRVVPPGTAIGFRITAREALLRCPAVRRSQLANCAPETAVSEWYLRRICLNETFRRGVEEALPQMAVPCRVLQFAFAMPQALPNLSGRVNSRDPGECQVPQPLRFAIAACRWKPRPCER